MVADMDRLKRLLPTISRPSTLAVACLLVSHIAFVVPADAARGAFFRSVKRTGVRTLRGLKRLPMRLRGTASRLRKLSSAKRKMETRYQERLGQARRAFARNDAKGLLEAVNSAQAINNSSRVITSKWNVWRRGKNNRRVKDLRSLSRLGSLLEESAPSRNTNRSARTPSGSEPVRAALYFQNMRKLGEGVYRSRDGKVTVDLNRGKTYVSDHRLFKQLQDAIGD